MKQNNVNAGISISRKNVSSFRIISEGFSVDETGLLSNPSLDESELRVYQMMYDYIVSQKNELFVEHSKLLDEEEEAVSINEEQDLSFLDERADTLMYDFFSNFCDRSETMLNELYLLYTDELKRIQQVLREKVANEKTGELALGFFDGKIVITLNDEPTEVEVEESFSDQVLAAEEAIEELENNIRLRESLISPVDLEGKVDMKILGDPTKLEKSVESFMVNMRKALKLIQ